MPTGREELLTWLMLSEGAGFTGGRALVDVTGPDGLTISKGFMNGAKFHHGQIVGGYELPKDASPEAGQAYLESKRFVLTPTGPATSGSRSYRAEYPNLWVPPMTPDRTTQILVILQLYVMASTAGEWEVRVTLQPQSDTGIVHELPAARVAAVDPGWIPVVSGLNPRTIYDPADRAEQPLPEGTMDLLVQRSGDPRLTTLPAAEARSLLTSWHGQMRDRHYKDWLHDLRYKQQHLPGQRGFDHPAVASNVAILPDEGQATLDTCRSYLEGWLQRVVVKGGEIRLRAERHMTEKLHIGKFKKVWQPAAVLDDKVWAKLFDHDNDYQAIVVEFVPEGAELPIAGMGLHHSLRVAAWKGRNAEQQWNEHQQLLMALTLGKLRGRPFDGVMTGHTLHVFNWVIAHDTCFEYLETSVADMTRKLDALAAECLPLQAWHGQSAWIPRFDLAGGFEATSYEDMSVLNFFRGILFAPQHSLTDQRMTSQWCTNVLRMVSPHMWLCDNLIAQVDRNGLERVATVAKINGSHKIEKRPDFAMDDFELALLPILPVETARLSVV